MKKTKLVFIGNGFDLHFGLLTSFCDFEKFVVQRHYEEIDGLDEMFLPFDHSEESLWRDFENNLANINEDFFFQNLGDTHEETKEAFCVIQKCKEILKSLFEQWVNSISCEIHSEYTFVSQDVFIINFNYTPTFEKNFNVQQNQIYHIHGTQKNNIIFGHQRKAPIPPKNIAPYDMDSEDAEYYTEAKLATVSWLNSFLEYTKKPVDTIISQSEQLLVNTYQINFLDIEEVLVIGHSYSDIDFPYFEWISKKTNAVWRLGYYKTCSVARRFADKIQAKKIIIEPIETLISSLLEKRSL